jgi:hypothetical protein
MADCWVFGGRHWFHALLWDHVPDEFTGTPEHHAYMDILLSAARTPELHEVVFPCIAEEWELLQTKSDSEQIRYIWPLATRLGVFASLPVWPEVANLKRFTAALEFIPADVEPDAVIKEQVVVVAPNVYEPSFADDDQVTARLIAATVRVVGNSGAAKASMTRVCRAAGVTTGSAKPRFATHDELMSRGFLYAIIEVSRQNASQSDEVFGDVSPIVAYVRLVIASLHPSRKMWRRYRQEMHLAARTNPLIAQNMQKGRTSVSQVLSNILRSSNVGESIIEISILVNQAQSVGFSLLDDLGMQIRDMNHAIIPTLINEEVLASLAD